MDDIIKTAADALEPLHEDFRRLLDTMDEETTIAFARDVRSYYDQHVSTADNKAGSVLALALPALGVFLHFGATGWRDVTRWAGIASLFMGILFALLAIQPRRAHRREAPFKGFLFWEHLRPYDSTEEYQQALAALDGPAIIAAYGKQHFAIAWTLRKKYFWLHRAVPAVVAGLVLAGIGLAIP